MKYTEIEDFISKLKIGSIVILKTCSWVYIGTFVGISGKSMGIINFSRNRLNNIENSTATVLFSDIECIREPSMFELEYYFGLFKK